MKKALTSVRLPLRALAYAAALLVVGSASASAKPPTIEAEYVTGVTASSATLNAQIDPNGLETVYKLQIDTTGNFKFDQSESCELYPPEAVCLAVVVPGDPLPAGLIQPPEATLPSEIGSQLVSVDLSEIGAVLQPQTIYHFRAIAANSNGFTYGPDLTFTTPAEPEGEIISSGGGLNVKDSGGAPGSIPSPPTPPSISPSGTKPRRKPQRHHRRKHRVALHQARQVR